VSEEAVSSYQRSEYLPSLLYQSGMHDPTSSVRLVILGIHYLCSSLFPHIITYDFYDGHDGHDGCICMTKSQEFFIRFAVAFLLQSTTTTTTTTTTTPPTLMDIDRQVASSATLDLVHCADIWITQPYTLLFYRFSPIHSRPHGSDLPKCACGLTRPTYTNTTSAENTDDGRMAIYEYPKGHRATGGGFRLRFDLRPCELCAFIRLDDGSRVLRRRK
jgi:hypothetical protein